MASVTSSSNGIFSIHGMGLKLTTADDAEPYTAILSDMGDAVTEVHFGGNTLGVEACRAIAAVVKTKTHLKVSHARKPGTRRARRLMLYEHTHCMTLPL